jgi:hypothetical protein
MKDLASRDTVYTPAMQVDGFSIDDPLTWTQKNVFVVFHLLYYERIATLYFRRYEKVLVGCRKQTSGGPAGMDTETNNSTSCPSRGSSTDIAIKLQYARSSIYACAHRMSKMLHDVLERGLLQMTPSFV